MENIGIIETARDLVDRFEISLFEFKKQRLV